MRVYIEAQGIRECIARNESMIMARLNTQPAMVDVAAYMMLVMRKNFESGGRRGGGSWKSLSEQWAERKAESGLDPRIGFASHALVDSLSEPGAPGQILDINDNFVRLGSDLPYAGTQQAHRPFAKFTIYDRKKMADIVRDFIVAAREAAV